MTQVFLRLSAELPLRPIDAKNQRFQLAHSTDSIRTVFPLGPWQHWFFQNLLGGWRPRGAGKPRPQTIYSLQGQTLLGACKGPLRHGPPTAALLREWPEGERPRVGRADSCNSLSAPVPGPIPSLRPSFFETLAWGLIMGLQHRNLHYKT